MLGYHISKNELYGAKILRIDVEHVQENVEQCFHVPICLVFSQLVAKQELHENCLCELYIYI